MTEKQAPRAAARRRNPSKSAAEMRAAGAADRLSALLVRVSEEWKDYGATTPIAVETFVPITLCEALDELCAELAAAKTAPAADGGTS